MEATVNHVKSTEEIENVGNLPNFLQNETFVIENDEVKALSFIAVKKEDKVVLSPFSFVTTKSPVK